MDWSPLSTSIKTASLATTIAVIFGVPVAYILSREWRGKAFASGLVLLPLVLPPTVLGYFLLVALGKHSYFGSLFQAVFHHQLVFTWEGAAVAASIASIPLLISQASVGFAAIGNDLIGAAEVDGASRFQILRLIILPLARRGLLAGVSLAFARSLGDFGATLMVAGDIPGTTQTMPLAIYDALQIDDNRTVLAYVVIASIIAVIATMTASHFAEK